MCMIIITAVCSKIFCDNYFRINELVRVSSSSSDGGVDESYLRCYPICEEIACLMMDSFDCNRYAVLEPSLTDDCTLSVHITASMMAL